MRTVRLDFIAVRHGRLLRGLLLLLAVLPWLLVLGQQRELNQALQERQATLAANHQQLSRVNKTVTPRLDTALQQRITQANTLWDGLNQPWVPLLAALEQAGSKQVALLQLETDPVKQQLRIIGEVKQRQALLDYMARLERLPELGNVVLQEHHINVQDKEQPIRFTLQAQWEPQP